MATDDFDRADNNSLGVNWTEDEVAAGDLRIFTNQMAADDNGGADNGFSFWNTDLGADHFSELVFKSANLAFVQPQSGPTVRIPTSATRALFSGYVALCDPGAQQVTIRKYNAQALSGAGTILATASTVTFTDGDVFRIEAEGATVRVKKNGVTIATATDSALTGGRPGIVVKEGYIL